MESFRVLYRWLKQPTVARTLAFYLSFVAVGTATASFGPSIPSFAAGTGETLARVGALFVFHRIGYISGSMSSGRLIDRVSGTLVTGIALLFIGAGLIAVPLVRSIHLLWAVILVIGFSQGSTEVGANTGIVRLHGEQAGPAMNGLHLSYGVGAIIAPLVLMLALGRTGSILGGYWVLAALTLVAAVGVLRVPDPRTETAAGRERLPAGSARLVVLLVVLLFCTIGGEASMGGWIYSYSIATGIGSARAAGLLTSAFWGMLTLGRLLGVVLVRKLGARRLILLNTIGAVLAMSLFLMIPELPVGVWVAVALLGLSQASIVPAVFTYAGQLRVLSGGVAGLFVSGASAGAMTLPWLVGQTFERIGPVSFVRTVWVSQLVALAAFCGVLLVVRLSGARNRPASA